MYFWNGNLLQNYDEFLYLHEHVFLLIQLQLLQLLSCLYFYIFYRNFSVYHIIAFQIPIFNFICRSTVDHFSRALHAIKLLKLHLVIYFYPISPTKIFMPVCIFRFYQYMELLTWGTLKQVIRVYCTIKSMTFLKIFSFGDKIFISVTLFMVHRLSKTVLHSMCLYSYIHFICQWIFQVFWFSVEREKNPHLLNFFGSLIL